MLRAWPDKQTGQIFGGFNLEDNPAAELHAIGGTILGPCFHPSGFGRRGGPIAFINAVTGRVRHAELKMVRGRGSCPERMPAGQQHCHRIKCPGDSSHSVENILVTGLLDQQVESRFSGCV